MKEKLWIKKPQWNESFSIMQWALHHTVSWSENIHFSLSVKSSEIMHQWKKCPCEGVIENHEITCVMWVGSKTNDLLRILATDKETAVRHWRLNTLTPYRVHIVQEVVDSCETMNWNFSYFAEAILIHHRNAEEI